MNPLKNSEDITFQVTVGQLTILSCLPKEHIHVTICIGNVSKITCSGKLAQNGLRVQWDHPFLFSAPPTTPVQIAIWILPKELTLEWDKQPLGDQIVTNVASLLESSHICHCNVLGCSGGPATLSITCRARDMLIVPYGHDCLSALRKYHTKLYNFGMLSINMASISTQIEVELARLDLCPLGHPNHTSILNDLGIAYSFHYDQDGDISDLNTSIEIHQRRLALCPLGHAEHANALGGLAMVLSKHYNIQKNEKDLTRLIDMKWAWLTYCPVGHSNHAKALGSFAKSLQDRYLVQGDLTDLEKAIEMEEKWLGLCPTGHPDYHTALNNLALSLNSRYQKLGNLADLQRDIELKEKHLKLCPPGHQKHGLSLQNLALSLLDHYHNMNDHSDLGRVNNLFTRALETYPAYHRFFAFNVSQIAATTILLSRSTAKSGQSLPSVDKAFEAYRLLKRCAPAVSLDLLQATQAWVKNAEYHNHPSVLEAYQTLLKTLHHFTTFTSSLDSRHITMEEKVADAANEAFSCATRHGDFQMAAELLEQGRGIQWNQLGCFDVSLALAVLESSRERELARKFTQLSADLWKHAQRSVVLGQGADPYWRVHEEWQRVVDKIRSLNGLSRFLLPPCFDDLQRAAAYGPVIIVNASKYTCDALVVLGTRAPIRVPIHSSLDDIIQLCMRLSELTRNPNAHGAQREQYVKGMLRELWLSIVKPITAILQNNVQLPLGSRVWWYPTSKFTHLPFHAAGLYQNGMKNFMDIYVSSYTPSLSALLRTYDRIRSQTEARDIPGGIPNVIPFAAVGRYLAQLPEVEHEIQRIRNKTSVSAEVIFKTVTGHAATVEGAVQAFRDNRWVHVACHSTQHLTNPFDSSFAMGDGKLTLMRIFQERYTNSEFAFLSGDSTPVGDPSTPDEVLHIAEGMQFAGFNGVVGTLWKVDDGVARQVVTRFYKEMFKRPDMDFRHAAAALNTAVIETADEVSLEKRIVFVHIGI